MIDHAYIRYLPTGNRHMARYHWFISWMYMWIPPVTTFNCIFISCFLCCWRGQHVQWVSLCLLREQVLKDNNYVFPLIHEVKSTCTCSSSLHLPAQPLVFKLNPPTEWRTPEPTASLPYSTFVMCASWDFSWDIMCTLIMRHAHQCTNLYQGFFLCTHSFTGKIVFNFCKPLLGWSSFGRISQTPLLRTNSLRFLVAPASLVRFQLSELNDSLLYVVSLSYDLNINHEVFVLPCINVYTPMHVHTASYTCIVLRWSVEGLQVAHPQVM